MDVVILSEQGLSLKGEQGELCCKSAFPSMPIGFWNDQMEASIILPILKCLIMFGVMVTGQLFQKMMV
ncbi:MAG: hypothetical protein CM15mP117_02380 [Alphaproteobacteria bacterium]|nr:MAG: hypothetical protein CM15mP117_02380 [Alphaproteobacteria bacterium]